MSKLRDLRIARKFSVAFSVVCLLTAMLGVTAIVGFLKVNAVTAQLVNNNVPAVISLAKIRFSMATIRRTEGFALLCTAPDCAQASIVSRREAIAGYRAGLADYERLADKPGEQAFLSTMRDNADAYLQLSGQAMELAAAGKNPDALHLLDGADARQHYDTLIDALGQAFALNRSFSSSEGTRSLELSRQMQATICVILVLVVVLCAVIGLSLTRLIVPQLLAATVALERLAEKDLRAQLDVHGQDELGRLSNAYNVSVAVMREVLESLVLSADAVSSSASQACAHAGQTRATAQTQCNMTNQIAAASQEMTATIAEISRSAEYAVEASRALAETASRGGEIMQKTVHTMERIAGATVTVSERMTSLAKRSEEIGNVMLVIQEISEQTNLLALNAAIEAARAGEHGRGFAIVAGEVRRLAERTKGATKGIAATIHNIQHETRETGEVMEQSRAAVESGLGEAAGARETLEGILQKSRQVEEQIHQIATAATEQTAASNEIAQSVTQIAGLATESMRSVTETVESSRKLAELANSLDEVIHGFQTGAESRVASRPDSGARGVPAGAAMSTC